MYEFSQKSQQLSARLTAVMETYIYTNEEDYAAQLRGATNGFAPIPLLDELKTHAQAAGILNLFVPEEHAEYCDHGGMAFFD